MNKITSFTGNYRFLSNFASARIDYEGDVYLSIEHAYQAAKFPREKRTVFMAGTGLTAGQAKKLGRTATLPADWEIKKVELMREFVAQKYRFKNSMGGLLMLTGEAEIIEGNHWGDTFWGQCKDKGKNMLGVLLMQRRSQLFEEKANAARNVTG